MYIRIKYAYIIIKNILNFSKHWVLHETSDHVGHNHLLLRMEIENLCIHQSLDLILKDVAILGRVTQHPVIGIFFRIVGHPHFFTLSCLWDFDSTTLAQELEQYVDMLIFEGVLTGWTIRWVASTFCIGLTSPLVRGSSHLSCLLARCWLNCLSHALLLAA